MIAEEIILDLEPALAHLRDANATLSPALLATFSNLKKTDLAAFAKTWLTLPAERKSRVARLFAELAEENARLDFTPIFRHVLNDPDARVRVAAIEGLWEDQDPALAKILIGFLRNDPEAAVRASAAESLGRFVLLGEYDRITSTLA